MDELRKKLSLIPPDSRIFAFPERDLRLHAMLINTGYGQEQSHSYIWNGLKRGSRNFAVWQYTMAGRGRLRYGNIEYDVNPGQAILVRIPEDSCYYLPEDSDYWEHIFVSLSGSEIIRIWEQIVSEKGPVISFAPDSDTVASAMDIYEKMHRNRIDNPFSASALAYAMTMAIAGDLEMNKECGDYIGRKMRSTAEYVMTHLSDDLNVETLASMTNMSRYHFSRLFKSRYGQSPGEFIRNARMKHAIALIQSSKFNIKEISMRCGYHEFSYFCRAFKQKYNISPGEFRTGSSSNPHKGCQ